MTCTHKRLTSAALDQTMGVVCLDCGLILAYCWDTDHVPEALWNQAAQNDPNRTPCELSRENVCAICQEPF